MGPKYKLNPLGPGHSFHFENSGPSEAIIQENLSENCALQPFYIRQNREIAYYEYDRLKKKVNERGFGQVFNREGFYSATTYPGYVDDILETGESILALKTTQGISFYHQSKKLPQKFELLATDNRFHDVNNWNQANHTIRFGHFYSDKDSLGVLTHSTRGGVVFYVVSQDYLKKNHTLPLWSVGVKNSEILRQPIWHDVKTDFFIADTRRRGQGDIVLRNNEGLTLYEFKSDYGLDNFLTIPIGAKIGNTGQEDGLLFTDITHQVYEDILLWNDHGLFVYQYQQNKNSYELLAHHSRFSKKRGWKPEYFKSLQLFDIDGDRRNELILSGPQGITFLTFDLGLNDWRSVLDRNSLMGIDRYSRVLKVLASCSSSSSPNPILLTQDQSILRSFEIIQVKEASEKIPDSEGRLETELLTPKFNIPTRPNITAPQSVRHVKPHEKFNIRLAEQLDHSPLLKAVNTLNGQIQFTLALAAIPMSSGLSIPLTLSYDSQHAGASLLGCGWSSTPLEFITVETNESVFLEDHNYLLFIQGSLQILKKVNQSNDKWTFELNKQSDVAITYDVKEEKWSIETSEEILFYGSTATQWGITWKNWGGNGKAVSHQQPVALTWYLNEHHVKKSKQSLYYEYEIPVGNIPGEKSYAEYVYLKKITDRHDSSIVFEYGLKTANEYEDQTFGTATPRQSYYLQGYQIQTGNTKQNIQFSYSTDLNQRYLASIEQVFGTQRESVLQFSYEKIANDKVLARSTVPSGATINFDYEAVKMPPALTAPTSYSVGQSPSIVSGPGYTLLASLNKSNRLSLGFFNNGVTSCSDNMNQLQSLGTKSISHYHIVPQQSSISVELDYGTERDLYLFHRHRGQWSWVPKYYSFNKDALIRVGQDFVVVAKPNQSALSLYEWINDEGIWKERFLKPPVTTAKAPKRLSMYGRFIVVYDDAAIWIGYREKNTWQSRLVRKLTGWVSGCESTLRKLDLDDTNYKAVLDLLNQQGLNIQRNLILLSTLDKENEKLVTKIHLILLSNQYELTQEAEYEIMHENFESLGTLQVSLSEHGVRCDNKEIIFTSTAWQLKSIPKEEVEGNYFSHQLGNNYLLEKASKNDYFKLYTQTKDGTKQNVPLVNLMTTAAERIVLRYPYYLAYQTDEGEVKFIEFNENKLISQSLKFSGEQLYQGSPFNALVTYSPKSFVFRSLSSFLGSPLKHSVNCLTLSTKGIQRIVAYDYADSFNRSSRIYQKVTTTQGINKLESGWVEETRVYNTSSHQFTQYKKLFDSQGKLVLDDTLNESNENESQEEQKEPKSLLLDRMEQRIIADVSPYLLEDEEISYYGFETYEVNQIGTKLGKTWNFNEKNLIKQGFAFTGENYLHLEATKESNDTYFEGTFKPRRQDTTYMVSCWLRCNEPLELNQPVPFLKGLVFNDQSEKVFGALSRVKFQSGNWFYLELLINLPFVKSIYHEIETQGNPTDSGSEEIDDLTITVVVSATTNTSIDLDHIRFSPFDSVFSVSVYNSLMNQATAIIQTNGLTTRTFYNRLQQPIATLKEQGQLEFVVTETKTGHLFPITDGLKKQSSRVTFQPESGFYEEFDTVALQSRWIANEPAAWKISLGQLHHQADHWNQVEADSGLLDNASVALRYEVSLSSSLASLRWNWHGGYVELKRDGTSSTLSCSSAHIHPIKGLPIQGEWLLFVEKSRLWVWSEGVLLFDQTWSVGQDQPSKPWSRLMLEARGNVTIKDLFLMNNPSVKIEYFNRLGEKTQVVTLKDMQTVLVSEVLYDKLGRPAITSKVTALVRTSNQSLLDYYPDFITNDNPSDSQSVWNTGYLEGEVNRFNPQDRGFAYQRVVYAANPLNAKQAIGLPGRDFSVTGSYAKKISRNANIDFLTNLFPLDRGHRQHVEIQPNGRRQVEIFDRHDNRIALYQQVPGYDHQLSTYEYDKNNRLIKILPPLYHEKVRSQLKTQPLQTKEAQLSVQEKYWQRLGTHYVYDENGHVLSKTTPDTGTVTFTYTSDDKVRFMVFGTNQTNKIVYLDYNEYGQLYRTGHFKSPRNSSELFDYLDSSEEPWDAQDYQQFYYDNHQVEPISRNRIKRLVTFNEEEPFLEQFRFNADQQVEEILSQVVMIDKQYEGGRLQSLSYPITVDDKPFRLTYRYNKQGQLVSLGTEDNPYYYAKFDYHPTGQLASEHHQPAEQHGFVRHYHYSSPGFLERIKDSFLTEDLTYTEGGYGQAGYGDGMVMQTFFNATWFQNADPSLFVINNNDFANNEWVTADISTRCVEALINEGYLDKTKRPVKLFHPNEFNTLPLFCSEGAIGYKIATTLAERYLTAYGHQYAYGNHQELTKAKYFIGDPKNMVGPLTPTTFSDEISELTPTQSKSIWKALHQAQYLNQDKGQGEIGAIYGKSDRSFFREEALRDDLRGLETKHAEMYTTYALAIKKLLMNRLGDRRDLTSEEFHFIFSKWEGKEIAETQVKAQRIWNVLRTKGYLQDAPPYALSALETNFKNALRDFTTFIPDIVHVLSRHFAHVLGETTFDVESYEIDANGNHYHFYTGFDRYELSYRNGTNQVDTVNIDHITTLKAEAVFSMDHDGQGNVIKAMHREIQQIDYHPTSQRTTRILLTDGRSLKFSYNAKGERILKRVVSAGGEISKETHYIRDEQGKVLVDISVIYEEQESSNMVLTAYIYGPRGLLGFFRNNNYFSVVTDHAGSIRLVVKDGQVEAAYDYLPYGQLMRVYGNNPDAHILYRYTGQEWDEETGLYNFHARLYDPSIGRFYQIDPKEQYFSPYKYAGNSPISLVDPDGELAFLLICIGLAIAGAYIGGAASNDNWDPKKWDFKNPKTWAGIALGGLGGGLAPLGAGASVGFLTGLGLSQTVAVGVTAGIGVGGAYLSSASVNRNWDPTRWNWEKPGTYQAAFTGATAGTGILGGFGAVKGLYSGLSATGKGILIGTSSAAGAVLAYGGGVIANQGNAAFWQWNFNDPATWEGLLYGGIGGTSLPAGALKAGQFLKGNLGKIARNGRNFVQTLKVMRRILKGKENNVNSFFEHMKTVNLPQTLRASGRIIGGTTIAGGITYLQGSAISDSWDSWDMSSVATYQTILNGLLSVDIVGGIKKPNKINRCRRNANNCGITRRNRRKHKESERKIKMVANYVADFLKRDSSLLKSLSSLRGPSKLPVVISVVSTDDLMVAGLSGLKDSPGALFYYTHKKNWRIVINNGNTIGEPMVFNSNSNENTAIAQAIKALQDTKNYEKVFLERLIRKGLNKDKAQSIMKEYAGSRKRIENLQECVPNDVDSTLSNNVLDGVKHTNALRKALVSKLSEKEADIYVRNFENTKARPDSFRRGKMENDIDVHLWNKVLEGVEHANTLKKYLIETKGLSKEQADNVLMEYKKNKIPDKLVDTIRNDIEENDWQKLPKEGEVCPWDITNCAEPHALTGLFKQSEILNTNDGYHPMELIRHMAAYDTRTVGGKERCAQCKVTTQYIENVITDPDWILQMKKISASVKTKSTRKQIKRLQYSISKNKGDQFLMMGEIDNARRELLNPVLPPEKIQRLNRNIETRENQIQYFKQRHVLDEELENILSRKVELLEHMRNLNPKEYLEKFNDLNELDKKLNGLRKEESAKLNEIASLKEQPFSFNRIRRETVLPLEGYESTSKQKIKPVFPLSTTKNSNKRTIQMNYCALGAQYGSTYVGGITCSTNNIKMMIFPKTESIKLGKPEDTYSTQSCRPIEFNGRPSVYCEGEKTNIVYTPKIPQNPLDQLNNQLILLQVVLHEGKKVYHWFQNLFSEKIENYQIPTLTNISITDDQKTSWKEVLDNIEKQLTELSTEKTDLQWAWNILEDRKEEFAGLSRQSAKINAEIVRTFTENLFALITELEVIENLHLSTFESSKNIFKQKTDNVQVFNYKSNTILNSLSAEKHTIFNEQYSDLNYGMNQGFIKSSGPVPLHTMYNSSITKEW